MYGRVRDRTFWITDAVALPVQGTETRVNAGNEVSLHRLHCLDCSPSRPWSTWSRSTLLATRRDSMRINAAGTTRELSSDQTVNSPQSPRIWLLAVGHRRRHTDDQPDAPGPIPCRCCEWLCVISLTSRSTPTALCPQARSRLALSAPTPLTTSPHQVARPSTSPFLSTRLRTLAPTLARTTLSRWRSTSRRRTRSCSICFGTSIGSRRSARVASSLWVYGSKAELTAEPRIHYITGQGPERKAACRREQGRGLDGGAQTQGTTCRSRGGIQGRVPWSRDQAVRAR